MYARVHICSRTTLVSLVMHNSVCVCTQQGGYVSYACMKVNAWYAACVYVLRIYTYLIVYDLITLTDWQAYVLHYGVCRPNQPTKLIYAYYMTTNTITTKTLRNALAHVLHYGVRA